MKLFIDGDQSRAICNHCRKMVSLTFKRRDVPFSDKKDSHTIFWWVCVTNAIMLYPSQPNQRPPFQNHEEKR